MKIDVKIDTDKLVARTLKEQKRLVYAVTEAINKAGVAAQEKIRADMSNDFHLRTANKKGRKWLLDRIKFKFASVRAGRIFAEIFVDQKPRLLLGKFEKGGKREPFVGKNVAVPNPEQARQGGSIGGEVKGELTFKALGLKKVPNRSGRETLDAGHRSGLNRTQYRKLRNTLGKDQYQIKGRERTFLLRSTAKSPLGGVYQRIGPGRDDIRLVYSFKRAFMLKRVLHLVRTAKEVFEDKFRVELAIAFARRGGSGGGK